MNDQRDAQGKFTSQDPLRQAYMETLERNQAALTRVFGPAADEPPTEGGAGSFDGGARGSGDEGKPSMDSLIREASADLRAGARETNIVVVDGETSRY